jgi:Uma2 family endonuclease
MLTTTLRERCPGLYTSGLMPDGRHSMSASLIEQIKASPLLPEIIQEGQAQMLNEHRLRMRFYRDITPEDKWEFINGEIVMHSPALNRHLMATKRLFRLMDCHCLTRGCGLVHGGKAMTSFPRNDYQPDICFFGMSKAAFITPDTLRFPIPDLIVEVLSPSTEARDRGIKFTDYASHGVREYWIIDTVAETVELYRLSGTTYPSVKPQSDGDLTSEVLPGFEIPVRAIFGDAHSAAAMRALMG